MDKLKESIVRAEIVQRLLDDENINSAFLNIEGDIYKLWTSTKSDESDKREEIYREYRGLMALKARLQRYVNEGKKAQEEVAHGRKRTP